MTHYQAFGIRQLELPGDFLAGYSLKHPGELLRPKTHRANQFIPLRGVPIIKAQIKLTDTFFFGDLHGKGLFPHRRKRVFLDACRVRLSIERTRDKGIDRSKHILHIEDVVFTIW